MKKYFTILSILIAGFTNFTYGSYLSANLTISASLNGAQETPAVTTNAFGAASFVLNASHDTLCIHGTFSGLSGAITGTHIHEGAPGVSGGVIVDLTADISGNDLSATITGTALASLSIAKLLEGGYYLNVHTAANPNGEIRGQMLLETDYAFTADMNGDQETPAVVTSAFGLAVFDLYQDDSAMTLKVVVSNLSGPITGAHLHTGAPGVSGPVTVDLSSMVNGNVIEGEVDPLPFLADLLAGNIYINVHTAANPNGEIRGQVLIDKSIAFDIDANGNQEVPPVTTSAAGVGSVKINTAMDSLWYDIVTDGLSGAATGAHFHEGAFGIAGGVIIDLSSSINGNRIAGVITGSTITTDLVNEFLGGGIYFNVHTAANPGGEIRGQVNRYLREGYTFTINGSQEAPPTTATATGSGYTTIDRDQENAHIVAVVNGFSGTVTGAHIHDNVLGQSGGVIFDLTNWLVQSGNSAELSGWWTDDNATPFNATINQKFINDSVYINFHTAANPDGEVRGQIIRGADCFSTNSVVGVPTIDNIISDNSYFPNPASDQLNIQLRSSLSFNGTIQVIDLNGKSAVSQTVSFAAGEHVYHLPVKNLNTGVYMVRVYSAEGSRLLGKFVKE